MSKRRQLPTILPPENIHKDSPVSDRTQALMDIMESLGYPIVPVSKKRTAEQQAKLYAQGRETPGSIVTEKSGKPGDESKHQAGDAVDFAFADERGQPNFDESNPWDVLGLAAKTVGLEWGGDWKTLVDRPHVQMPNRAKFERGSQVAAYTDPASVKIGNAPVAPPAAPRAFGVGTAEARSRVAPRAVPPAPRVAERTLIDQMVDGMRGRSSDIELSASAPPASPVAQQSAPTPTPAQTPMPTAPPLPTPAPAEAPAMPAPQAPTPAPPVPAPAHEPTQTQSMFTVDVPGELINMPGAGMITVQIPANTPPDQIRDQAMALARTQAGEDATKTYGLQSPDGKQSVGFNLPDLIADPQQREIFQKALASVPQLAAFIAQLTPAGRAAGMAGSAGIPAAARSITNLMEGKPAGEGVVDEAAMGAALQMPFMLGQKAMKFGEGVVRHNIFRTTPVEQVTQRRADVLPKLAIETRAAATPEGVKEAMHNSADALNAALMPSKPGSMHIPRFDPKLKRQADDLKDLSEKLRDVTHQANVRGTGGASSMTSVLPGSGAATTGARAAGLPAAVGQLASPAVAAMKGSPARRIAWGRNIARPGGVVDSDQIGLLISQLLRLGAAVNDSGSGQDTVSETYVAPPPRRRSPQ